MTETTVPTPGVAVIGCGAWGRNHVRTLGKLGALAAVSDADPDAARAAGKEAGVPAIAPDDVFGDQAIAGVVIAVPDALHARIARQALAAGKHVLVEKPMATTVADAEALAAEAERRGLVLMVGHILRYHPAFVRLNALATAGDLGRLRHIAAKRLHIARGAPRHALWDLCPHDVSMILALAGRMPARVRAFVGAFAAPQVPQTGAVMLDFGDGLTADIAFSAIHPVKLHQITVAGSEAQGVFEDSRGWEEKLALYRPGLGRPGEVPAREAVAVAPAEPLAEEARCFLAAMAGGPQPPSGAAEGMRVVRVLAAAARSLESGGIEHP